jgi:hypothetical protein
MRLTFLISLLAIALLYATLCKYELTVKHTRAQVRALRRRLAAEGAGVAPGTRGRSAAPDALPGLAPRPAAGEARPAGSEGLPLGAGSAPGTVG